MDRVLATRMGFEAVEALLQGQNKMMVGIVGGKLNLLPLTQAVKHISEVNERLLTMAEIMAE
jgi:6-phosphofructokinase 1